MDATQADLEHMFQKAAKSLSDCSEATTETTYIAHQNAARALISDIEKFLRLNIGYDDLPWELGQYLDLILPYTNPMEQIPLLTWILEYGNAKELHLIFSQQLSTALSSDNVILSCHYAILMAKITGRIKTAHLGKFVKSILPAMESLRFVGASFFYKKHSFFSDQYQEVEKQKDSRHSLYECHLDIILRIFELNSTTDDAVEIFDKLRSWLVELERVLISTLPLDLYGAWVETHKPRLLAQRQMGYNHKLKLYEKVMHREKTLKVCTLLNMTQCVDLTNIEQRERLFLWVLFHWSDITSFKPFVSTSEFPHLLKLSTAILHTFISDPGFVDAIMGIFRMHLEQMLADKSFQTGYAHDLFEFLQGIGTFSAINESPSMRAFANDLYATIIMSLDGSLSLAFIKDVLERCPFDNLRAATIDVLKACFKQDMTRRDTVYSSHMALSELENNLYNLGIANLKDFSDKASTIMQTLNLTYFLLVADKDDKTGIRANRSVRERDFLGPLRKAVNVWSSGLESRPSQIDVKLVDLVHHRPSQADDWNTKPRDDEGVEQTGGAAAKYNDLPPEVAPPDVSNELRQVQLLLELLDGVS